MALKPVPNTMQANVRFLLFGQVVEMVFHVSSATGVDAQVMTDCLDMMAGWTAGNLMPHLSQDLSFTGVTVTDLSIEGGGQVNFEQVGGLAGSIAFAAEPGNVSYCVSLRTERVGRAYRGRKYLPGIPTSVRTSNQVSSGWAADIVTAFQALITALQSINQFLVVVSRTLDLVERLVPVATAVASITTTDLYIDSQRRRLTGRGT